MADPNEPQTPWWTNLVAILVTAVVTIPTTWYIVSPKKDPATPSQRFSGAFGLVKDTLTYIPHVLLLFGVLADMFTYQGVYSVSSIIGIVSIGLNALMQYFWTGITDGFTKLQTLISSTPAPPPPSRPTVIGRQFGGGKFFNEYTGCALQGFEKIGSPYAPQTLVITASIFSYYMFDLIMNRGWVNSAATITLFVVLFGAQAFSIGDCGGTDYGFSGWKAALAALAEGLLYGGTSYGIVQTYYPGSLPSSAISPFPRKRAEDLKVGPNGKYTDSAGNEYICLANGQCYPDLSSQESRKAFAEMAAQSMGTGTPAVPENCSANTAPATTSAPSTTVTPSV